MRWLAVIILLVGKQTGFSQDSSKTTRNAIIITSVSLVASDVTLYYAWYKPYQTGRFHWFNDNQEWFQIDKVGHAYSAYQVQRGFHALFKHRLKPKQAILYAGAFSLFELSCIEVMDGFSKGWGASSGDIIANVSGLGLFSLQEWFWHKQIVQLKFSDHPTSFAALRPTVLGQNSAERILKDYNGQTYWLSASLGEIFNTSKIPTWLCVSLGYGVNGMLGGHVNPVQNEAGISLPYFERHRQYYLSLDLDLTRIKTNNKVLRTLFSMFNTIKVPFPAVQFENKNLSFKPIYF